MEIINKDDDGTIYPGKRDWGYAIHCVVNGYSIASYDTSWYGAWQGAAYSARWAAKSEPFERRDTRDIAKETDDFSAIVGLRRTDS